MNFEPYIELDRKNYPYDELKEQTFPLFIWGGGNVASNVLERLDEHEIQVEGLIVKDDDPNLDNPSYNGRNIYSYHDATEEYEKFNIILGYAHYEKIDEISRLRCVNKVFYIMNPFPFEGISPDYYHTHKVKIDSAMTFYEDKESFDVYESYFKAQLSNRLSPILDVFRSPISYFDNDFIKLNDHENYIDVGAYDGDTIDSFLETTQGKYSNIIAVEADSEIFKVLTKHIEELGLKNVYSINKGAWNTDGKLYFTTDGVTQNGGIQDSGNGPQIDVVRLDSFVSENGLPKISFIKINFTQSSVIEVLEGAEKILVKDKPKIAIIAGLNENTVFEAPETIKRINPDYKIYLRYLAAMPARLAIFAV